MAINPHDDYESLAKLLYPSIEASGNVYYGQTRKLTIDEVFDKNNNGFESYLCSYKKEDDSSQYEPHFHWKLGPFSDTVKIVNETYKDYPLAWLKYSLTKNTVTNKNVLNSGAYNTYEVEYNLGLPTLYCTLDGALPNGNIYNNSNFFLDEEGKTLYILLYKAPVYEDMDKPLYIEALTSDIEVSLMSRGSLSSDQCKYKYGFDYTNLNNDLILDDVVEVKKGCRIYIRCDDRPEISPSEYLRLELFSADENAEVAVGGNIESVAKFEDGEMLSHSYYGLFSDNSLITDASKLYIDKVSSNGCRYLFSNCSGLAAVPSILPCFELKVGCFHNMFTNCSELENAPILPARDGVSGCYWRMFECDGNTVVSKLNKVVCLLSRWQRSYTPDWLSGRANIEIHALSNSNWDDSDESTIPQNSKIVYLESTIDTLSNDIQVSNEHIEKYLVVHGTNNENNGRGDITDQSTLANMENSFDENSNHPMNTYNADGSFNQEIWGYKSFCSPVQFRNGLYGECGRLTAIQNVGSTEESNISHINSVFASTITNKDTFVSVGHTYGESDNSVTGADIHIIIEENASRLFSSSYTSGLAVGDSTECVSSTDLSLNSGSVKVVSVSDSADFIKVPQNSISILAKSNVNENSNTPTLSASSIELSDLLLPSAKMSTAMDEYDNYGSHRVIETSVRSSSNGVNPSSGLYVNYAYNDNEYDAYAQLSIYKDTFSDTFTKNLEIKANIVPCASDDSSEHYDIGTYSERYNSVYANHLYGEIPYVGKSAYKADAGAINYSALHVYSDIENHEEILLRAGSVVTINMHNELYIDGVNQNVTAFLYNTKIENDLDTGTTKLVEGTAYGAIFNVSDISFTPLCDVNIKFVNKDAEGRYGKFTPPQVNENALSEIEFNQMVAIIADQIKQEEIIRGAIDIGNIKDVAGIKNELFGNYITGTLGNYFDKLTDNADTIFTTESYINPVNNYYSVGVLDTTLNNQFIRSKTYNIIADDNNITDISLSNVRLKIISTSSDGSISEEFTADEKQAVTNYAIDMFKSNAVTTVNSVLRNVGLNITIDKSKI